MYTADQFLAACSSNHSGEIVQALPNSKLANHNSWQTATSFHISVKRFKVWLSRRKSLEIDTRHGIVPSFKINFTPYFWSYLLRGILLIFRGLPDVSPLSKKKLPLCIFIQHHNWSMQAVTRGKRGTVQQVILRRKWTKKNWNQIYTSKLTHKIIAQVVRGKG